MTDSTDDALYRPVIPEGAYLAYSKDNVGAHRALLFEHGTGKLLGPPELLRVEFEEPPGNEHVPVPDDGRGGEPELTVEGLIGALALLGGVAAVQYAAPHFATWWREKIRPRLRRRKPAKPHLRVAHETEEIGVMAGEIEVLVADNRPTMSTDEAHRHLSLMLMHTAAAAEHARTLRGSRIEEGPDRTQMDSMLERFADKPIAETVNRFLEVGPGLLTHDESAEFMRLFGGGAQVDGRYIPLNEMRVRRALQGIPEAGPYPSQS